MKQTRFNVQLRRKRENKTNYRKRFRLLVSGKCRLVVRPSLNNTAAQIVLFDVKGDKIIASAHSSELKKLGWKYSNGNIPAAYLTGLSIGKKAKEKNIKEAILDIGMKTPTKGSRTFACLKGAVDAGLDVPHSAHVLPSEERIKGSHIINYADKIKSENKETKQFKTDISELSKNFEEVKSRIVKVK